MTAGPAAALRRAPVTVPCLAAVALFVAAAADQAGYPVVRWAPGALIVLALLIVAATAIGSPLRAMPAGVKVALGSLAAYTALSYLSILWASVPGDALEGADRTLLYLLVFTLFAAWPQRGETAAVLLGAWALSIAGLALYVLIHLGGDGAGALAHDLPGGRLLYPSGYPNANAAQWLMAFWPALLLARGPRLHWALRGLLAGCAVLLALVALLSQSRGSLYATPIMLVLVFALLPGRVRTVIVLVPVALAVGAAAPAVLHVGDNLAPGGAVRTGNVGSAVTATLLASALAGLVVALLAAVEARGVLAPASRARVRRAVAVVALAGLAAVAAAGLVAAGNPVNRVRSAWHSFKGGYGQQSGPRLVSGLGSNRYDFYRVALDEFDSHPLLGIGADNFQVAYLRHGRSDETPRYPHSVEIRTLSQTGVVGSLLAIAGLAAALLMAFRASRRDERLAASVAAASVACFGYWAVHGSVDWFWEFAGLGAPAFAFLGLSCALAPRAAEPPPEGDLAADRPSGPPRRGPRMGPAAVAATVAAAALAAAGAYALAVPWLSGLEVQSAGRIWPQSPRAAYDRLERAAGLDPLSADPYLVAGSIALRFGDLPRADRWFAQALERSPDDAYALLERGAIASYRGEAAAARALLGRAHAAAPRDATIAAAMALAARGRPIDVAALNRSILAKARQIP